MRARAWGVEVYKKANFFKAPFTENPKDFEPCTLEDLFEYALEYSQSSWRKMNLAIRAMQERGHAWGDNRWAREEPDKMESVQIIPDDEDELYRYAGNHLKSLLDRLHELKFAKA